MNTDEKLNFYQLAKRFDVCVGTLYSWLHRGWLPPPLRLGKRTFWLKSTIDDWEQAGYPRPCDEKNEVLK